MSVIERIIELATPADPEKYRAYLQTLHGHTLGARLRELEEDRKKDHAPNWRRVQTRRRPAADRRQLFS